jgi:hypothetical protein
VLAGIVFIGAIGRFMMYGAARARSRNAGASVFVGVGLLAIGAIGLVLSQLIKAAVSRQREYLADASSVQFTRNPDAIAGALDQIGLAASTRVANRYAEDMSHMYFANSAPALFATHPPIAERIRRAHPRFDAESYRKRRAAPVPPEEKKEAGQAKRTPEAAFALIGALEPGRIDLARRLMASIPAALHGEIETPEGARAFLLSLMSPGCEFPRALRLPAIDLALPALKAASPEARREAVAALEAQVHADRRVLLDELVVLVLVRDQLSGAPESPAGRRTLAELRAPADLLVSLFSAADAGPQAVTGALEALKALAPREKEKLMKELAAAAFAGGELQIAEAELLRAVGAVLDCPLPPFGEA